MANDSKSVPQDKVLQDVGSKKMHMANGAFSPEIKTPVSENNHDVANFSLKLPEEGSAKIVTFQSVYINKGDIDDDKIKEMMKDISKSKVLDEQYLNDLRNYEEALKIALNKLEKSRIHESTEKQIKSMIDIISKSTSLTPQNLQDLQSYELETIQALNSIDQSRKREIVEHHIKNMIQDISSSKVLSNQKLQDLRDYEKQTAEALNLLEKSRNLKKVELEIGEIINEIYRSKVIDVEKHRLKTEDVINYDLEIKKAISRIWKTKEDKEYNEKVSHIIHEITQKDKNSTDDNFMMKTGNTFYFKYDADYIKAILENSIKKKLLQKSSKLKSKPKRAVEILFAEFEFNSKFPRPPIRPNRKKRSPSLPALNMVSLYEDDSRRKVRPPRRKQSISNNSKCSVSDINAMDLSGDNSKKSSIKDTLTTRGLDLEENSLRKSQSHYDVRFSSPEISFVLPYLGKRSPKFLDGRESINIINMNDDDNQLKKQSNITRKSSTFTKGDIYMNNIRDNISAKKKSKSVSKLLRRTFSFNDLPNNRDNPPCMPNLLKRYKLRKKRSKGNLPTIKEETNNHGLKRSQTSESFASIFMSDYTEDDTDGSYLERCTSNFEPYESLNSLHFPVDAAMKRSASHIEITIDPNKYEITDQPPIKTPRLKRSRSFTGMDLHNRRLNKLLNNDDSTFSLDPEAIRKAHELLAKSVGDKGSSQTPVPPKRTRSRLSLNDLSDETMSNSQTFDSIFTSVDHSDLVCPKTLEPKSSYVELSIFYDDQPIKPVENNPNCDIQPLKTTDRSTSQNLISDNEDIKYYISSDHNETHSSETSRISILNDDNREALQITSCIEIQSSESKDLPISPVSEELKNTCFEFPISTGDQVKRLVVESNHDLQLVENNDLLTDQVPDLIDVKDQREEMERVEELNHRNEALTELNHKNETSEKHNEDVMRAFCRQYSDDLKTVGIDVDEPQLSLSEQLLKVKSSSFKDPSSSLLDDLNDSLYPNYLGKDDDDDDDDDILSLSFSEDDLELLDLKKSILQDSEIEDQNGRVFKFPYLDERKLNISKDFTVDGEALTKDCEDGTLNIKLQNLTDYYEKEMLDQIRRLSGDYERCISPYVKSPHALRNETSSFLDLEGTDRHPFEMLAYQHFPELTDRVERKSINQSKVPSNDDNFKLREFALLIAKKVINESLQYKLNTSLSYIDSEDDKKNENISILKSDDTNTHPFEKLAYNHNSTITDLIDNMSVNESNILDTDDILQELTEDDVTRSVINGSKKSNEHIPEHYFTDKNEELSFLGLEGTGRITYEDIAHEHNSEITEQIEIKSTDHSTVPVNQYNFKFQEFAEGEFTKTEIDEYLIKEEQVYEYPENRDPDFVICSANPVVKKSKYIDVAKSISQSNMKSACGSSSSHKVIVVPKELLLSSISVDEKTMEDKFLLPSSITEELTEENKLRKVTFNLVENKKIDDNSDKSMILNETPLQFSISVKGNSNFDKVHLPESHIISNLSLNNKESSIHDIKSSVNLAKDSISSEDCMEIEKLDSSELNENSEVEISLTDKETINTIHDDDIIIQMSTKFDSSVVSSDYNDHAEGAVNASNTDQSFPVRSTPVEGSFLVDKPSNTKTSNIRPDLHHMQLGLKLSSSSSTDNETTNTDITEFNSSSKEEVESRINDNSVFSNVPNKNNKIFHFPSLRTCTKLDEILYRDLAEMSSPLPSPVLAIRELYKAKDRKVIEVESPATKRRYFISSVVDGTPPSSPLVSSSNNFNFFQSRLYRNRKNEHFEKGNGLLDSPDELESFHDDSTSKEDSFIKYSNRSDNYNSIKENCCTDECRCAEHDFPTCEHNIIKIVAVHGKKLSSGESSPDVPVRTWPERQDRSDELSTPSPVLIPKWVKECDSDTDIHFYLPQTKDTSSPGPPHDSTVDEIQKIDSKSLTRKEEDRTQQDCCIEVYPETLRQRQRNMAPSPNKVDIKNWEPLPINNNNDSESKSNKKLLPSVKALRNQFENGKTTHRDISPSGREVMSPNMTSSNMTSSNMTSSNMTSSNLTSSNLTSSNLGRTSSNSSTSSLAMSSLEVSSGFGSLTSSQATLETSSPRDQQLDDEPVEAIYRQFQATDHEIHDVMSKPPSTTAWDPIPLLTKLYYVPETPKLQGQKTNYINIDGYLEKLPSGRKKATFWNAWKRRFFVAKDGVLFYYQNEISEKPNMKLPLMGGKVEIMEPNMVSVDDGEKEIRGASMLGIDDGKGHYVVVRCISRQEAEKWKKALDTQVADDYSVQFVNPWPLPTNPSLLRDTLIVDIGSCSVRAGVLASQPTLPQLFFPSIIGTKRDTRNQIVGMEALSVESRTGSVLSFPVRPSHKISKFSVDLNAISSLLQKTFTDLNVDPRNFNLQLSVPRVLNPYTQGELLKILFDKFGIKSVNITHQSILALYAYNATSGIVVDIGERIDVVPVIDGYIVDGGVSRVPYGGHRIMEHLRHFLSQRNLSLVNEVDSYVIRNVLENVCYCAQHYNTEKSRCNSNPDSFDKTVDMTDYFPDKPEFEALRNISLDYGRFQATEGIFNPDSWGLDHPGLHKLVHKAIQECSMDIRKEMSRSIFLVGGISQLPGIGERLASELDNLTPLAIRPKVHASPYRYHGSYLGACVLAESDAFNQSKITKEEWQKQGNSALRKWAL